METKKKKNLPTLIKLVGNDNIFDKKEQSVEYAISLLQKKYPDSIALQKRMELKLPDNTFLCVKSSLLSQLSLLADPDMAELLSYNELDLSSFAKQKTALFINTSDINQGTSRLVEILLTQIFKELYRISDGLKQNSFKHHIMFMLDDAGTYIGNIPNINAFMATCRSRNISVSLLLQSLIQLQDGKVSMSITDNCDVYAYYGSLSNETNMYFAQLANLSYEKAQSLPKGQLLLVKRYEPAKIVERFELSHA